MSCRSVRRLAARSQLIHGDGPEVHPCPPQFSDTFLDLHRIESAIDEHFGAGDEGAGIGGEQEGGSDEFVSIAEAGGEGVDDETA
jgi:hypothetical protein